MDLYGQIDVGTKVVVLSPAKRPRRNNATVAEHLTVGSHHRKIENSMRIHHWK